MTNVVIDKFFLNMPTVKHFSLVTTSDWVIIGAITFTGFTDASSVIHSFIRLC